MKGLGSSVPGCKRLGQHRTGRSLPSLRSPRPGQECPDSKGASNHQPRSPRAESTDVGGLFEEAVGRWNSRPAQSRTSRTRTRVKPQVPAAAYPPQLGIHSPVVVGTQMGRDEILRRDGLQGIPGGKAMPDVTGQHQVTRFHPRAAVLATVQVFHVEAFPGKIEENAVGIPSSGIVADLQDHVVRSVVRAGPRTYVGGIVDSGDG